MGLGNYSVSRKYEHFENNIRLAKFVAIYSCNLGYGIFFHPAKVRIEQMKEATKIIKQMWTEHKRYFKGKYYNLNGALNYPKPLQKPYPKIWFGGVGKTTLKVVAEVGDGINLMGSPEDFERKRLAETTIPSESLGQET
jgi:alkanesulfonate monooxygenase SsuD/methylene tetrahydromethanopterin reductase-like flavin-dependent oxidoreductase (luciferase family)